MRNNITMCSIEKNNRRKNDEIAKSISLGMVLRVLREFSGLSIAELSKELKISTTAINHLENDKCKPSAETLTKYSNFFEVSTDKILFWTKESKTATERKIKDVLFSLLLNAARKNKRF